MRKDLKILIWIIFFPFLVFSQDVLISDGGTINICNGTFYDSGGPNGVYSANEDYTITICPESPTQTIQLDFQSFTTQPVQNGNGDGLIIYNGDDTSATQFGVFSGTTATSSPGFIQADNPTGCLTIQFFSNGAAQASGWEAIISCFEPCQDVSSSITSVPGVNNGSIEVDVDEIIDFTGVGQFSNGISDNAIYQWNFGDGNTGLGENIQYSFSNAGLYNVTLIVTDYNNCSSEVSEVQIIVGASTPGNPYVSAGDDVTLVCETSVNLSADFLEIGETSSYTIQQIPFVPPFPFNGLSNSVNTNIDDAWDNPQTLPFDFCFFGNLEQQFQVGSNGLIRFDTSTTDVGSGSNAWGFSNADNIPSNTPDAIGEGNIFSPVHDIDPAASDNEEIRWEIIGDYPNRVLAVSYYNVEMYSFNCSDLFATHMIVLYETTNVIDIYIQNKPSCETWQGGVAALGIQNDAGTQGYVPPGRNSSDSPWTTQEEAWRFTPAGDSIIIFEWFDNGGNIISTNPDFETNISETETFTARVTYSTCTGNPIIVEDQITVTVEDPPFDVNLGDDLILCSDSDDVTIDADIGTDSATYEWALDGNIINGEINSQLVVSSPNSGIYTVFVNDQNCIVSDEISISYGNVDDSSFELTPTCDGATATVLGVGGGTFSFDQLPTDGAVIDPSTGTITGGSFNTTYSVVYTTNDDCPSASVVEVTSLQEDDSSFELTPTCDGATATVLGVGGGTFSFDQLPTDGAVIDPSTGTITGGSFNTTYSVVYTTNDDCPSASVVEVTSLQEDDSSFELTPTCDGATATVLGVGGGTFSFDQLPTDGAVIDPSTGTITGGSFNTTYSVVYTTNDDCPSASVVEVTSLQEDDSSFELTPTCDGATATVLGVGGGTFSFDQLPTDGAVIDPSTGTITGGSFNTTYSVVYTTNDDCPSASVVEVTSLQEDDSSFELTPTCDGATATVLGVGGGTFSFDQLPTDGAVIDPSTGTITGGSFNTTYSVVYTTNDVCPSSTTNIVTSYEGENSSFELTPTCDGATATVLGVGGGTFSFDQLPTDGAVIDPSTGTITAGSFNTTYVVNYTTNGTSFGNSSSPCSISELPLDLQENVLGYWPFCGNADDTSGNGNDGIVSGPMLNTDRFGNVDNAYEFDNTGTNIYNDSQFISLGEDYSISMWFNSDDVSQGNQCIFNSIGHTGIGLSLNHNYNPGRINLFIGDGINFWNADGVGGSKNDYNNNQWYHILLVKNGINYKLYVDNIIDIDIDVSASAGYTNSVGFRIGSISDTNLEQFNGLLDDLIIWGEALSSNDVSDNIQCPTTTVVSVTTLPADDSSFELTPTCDGATAVITGLDGGIFEFAIDPNDGSLIDSATGTISNAIPGNSYDVSYTTIGECPTTTTQSVVVNSPPDITEPTPLEVCDDNIADGLTEIDLTLKNIEITNGNPNYSVSYFLNEQDAIDDINILSIPYLNVTNPQTVFARVTNINTSCFTTTSLALEVITAPSANLPQDLIYCDADADGFGVFDLTQLDGIISAGQIGLSISYHETQADAENNVNAIVGDYNNIVAYEQIIYIRVESSTVSTDCGTFLTTMLIVNDVPQINTEPSYLEVCDDNTDGFGLFDLSLSNEEVLDGLDPSEFTITYYENAENAENAENPIITPFAYTNVTPFNQTIWVRVENNTTNCYNTTTIELTVNELPVLIQPTPLNLCDYINTGDEIEEFTLEDSIEQVLQGQTGINISFYETQEDADNDTNPIFSPYTNTSNAQTIYIRGENEITGCYSTITLDLRVNPIPSPAVPQAIEECDEDNDGFTFFTVEQNEVDIINGELDIVLSYHETLTNAENGIEPIISPYYNIVPDSQIIFVRAENTITGCFSIVEQELVTLPSPELPLIIEDIIICDDDYDGTAIFDLTQRDEDILGEQSSTDFALSYHETLIDAEIGQNPIVNTTSYQNLSNPQTIYVRLEDLNNNCVSIGEFNLIVALPPVIVQPTPLEECDDEVADETTEFDLTIKNDEITAGNLQWEVIYYETEQDALSGLNAIENPEAYTNISVAGNAANPQTLHVAVVNESGCIAYTTLTIRVLPNPTPSTDPENIELCDYNNPGDQIEIFDITLNEAYIINGEPGVSASYYESLVNAETQTDPIINPNTYTNIELGEQTIYVRVTNDTTGCFTIVNFDIIVNPLPDISSVNDIIACEVNTDGFYDFDLQVMTSELLGTQNPDNFTVTYYETQEDANNLENALISPYTNLTNPQQLFVNITNDLTSCNIAGVGFNIEVQEGATANGDGVPVELTICDDPLGINDGFDEFNLSDLDEQVLDGQDPANFTVTYYATLEDAEAFVNALPINFENTSNPQVIYARVDNDTTDDSQCYDIIEATLLVNLLPEFTLPENYLACVNVNGTELIEETVMEINLPASQYSFQWIDPNGVIVANTATHTPTMGGIYTGVATNIITGCSREVTTEVIPSSPAIVEALVTTLAFADQHVIEANAVGSGNYEYSLDDGPWQLNGIFTDVSPGEHTVTVRDLNGCGIGTKSVLVIDYPRFFTPNGDGYNDTWQIIGIETRPMSTIYIFDRYGKLLKQLSPLGQGWDGTFNGKPLPATDYWFSVEYEEPGTNIIKTFRAHFSLKR